MGRLGETWGRAAQSSCLILAVSFAAGPSGAESLSFDDAVTGVRTRNEAVMAAQDDLHQRAAEVEAAKGLRYPKAEIEFRHTFLNAPITIGVDPIPLSLVVQERGFSEGQLKVSLPVYAGGRIEAANRAAAARYDEASAQILTTEDGLVTELAQRYFGLRMATRALEVQNLKVKNMEQHAHRAKRLMEEGMIARVECLNAEVALANARTEQAASERDVTIIREALANILVGGEMVEPTSPLFMVSDLEPCETFQGYVNDEHPILQMLAAKRNLARQGTQAEEAGDKPLVYLFGMHELVPSDLTMLDPEWAVGLGVQMTLFDGFQTRNKVEAAKAVEQKVAHLTQKATRDLRTLVLKRYEEANKARDQFVSFDATIDLTRENLRVRTRAFEEGMATSLEVVDATLSLARAELGRFKAAFDFDVALFQLLEASGRTRDYQTYLARAVPLEEVKASSPVMVQAEDLPAPQPEQKSP